MADKNVGTFCLFLFLSIAAHTSFIYSVYRPVVAAQSLEMPVEVSLITEKSLVSEDAVSMVDIQGSDTASPSSISVPVESAGVVEAATGMLSDVAEQSDVVMLPLLRAHELLEDRIVKTDFAETEYVQPVSLDPQYRSAVEVHRRVRAQQDLKPIYPKAAYDANLSGRVIVELLISDEGVLDDIRIIAATHGFERSARNSLQGMTFYPAELDGKKVASRMFIEMKYLLVKQSSKRASEENIISIETLEEAVEK